MSEDDPTLLCCPYCIGTLAMMVNEDEAFNVPASCKHCGMDPRNDALIEVRLSGRARMAKQTCSACGAELWALASHCSKCHVRLGSAKKPAAKKPAPKKPAAKKPAPKKPAPKKPAAKKPAPKKPAAKKPAPKKR